MYRQSVTVMPSEAACTNEIKIRALLNRLQDAASLAVKDYEGSPSELMRRGYAWVLLKYELVTGRLPGIDEAVVIETRHTPNDGFHTLRVFRVFSQADEAETLVLAKTSWVLIDLAAGRPVRASQRLPEVFTHVAEDPPIDPDFAPVPRFSGPALKDAPLLRETEFPVRFHDLDSNGHANNAVYFEWAYEATPLDLMGWTVRSARAEFRVSAKFGETVRVRVKSFPCQDDVPADNHKNISQAFVYEMLGGRPGAQAGNKADEQNGQGEQLLARFYAVWTPVGEHLIGEHPTGEHLIGGHPAGASLTGM